MKKHTDNINAIIILSLMILLVRMIPVIPWWTFVVPVLLFGMFMTHRKWKVAFFLSGFIAGFTVWLGAGLYFHLTAHGVLFARFGAMPQIVLFLLSALIGGLLTGLACYTGKTIVYRKISNLIL